jgi:hypothetical protein
VAKVTDIGSPKRKPGRRPRNTSIAQRDSQEQMDKAMTAYHLMLGGKSHSEIAEILEIENTNDVWRLMSERFTSDASVLTNAERKDLLALETLRLNALMAAVWPAAMMGDPKSIDSAVRIIATRSKISGLEQVDPVVQKNLVLVMGDKEEDYIAALKAAEISD